MSVSFGENARSPFVKVWKVDVHDNYVKAQVSTSKKNKSGEYENSSWFATFLGKCVDKASTLSRGDMIKVVSGELNVTKKDDKSYTNMLIWAFEDADFDGEKKSTPKKSTPKKEESSGNDGFYTLNEDDEDLPF